VRVSKFPWFAPQRRKNPHSPDLKGEAYTLVIDQRGVLIEFREIQGLRSGIATLRQLMREHGRHLPCLRIRDWPDFARRGVMLDISRGRVPNLATLLDYADKLADFKINELQLYTEHTFAYRKYRRVWKVWGAISAREVRLLDARCRALGIDLVPNQNSFGHLREFLADRKLKPLAETAEPWLDPSGTFQRYPSTLAPLHPRALPFLRGLYDELLPNFSSVWFNVGCDETWDLGRGQTCKACARLGKGRIYLNFLKSLHSDLARRDRRMMFWGDIILHYPDLVRELPGDSIALNWGYEADHPFGKETRQFARAGVPFYVCPGTSTWATLVGKHDNAFANLRNAARAGIASGALGYLVTDWGDGGHPQPPAVGWLPLMYGAAAAWREHDIDESNLLSVASRDLFDDDTGSAAKAALGLGLAHRRLRHTTPNATPLGAAIAAPKRGTLELFCRDGLRYHARIKPGNLRSALAELEKQRSLLQRANPRSSTGRLLVAELDLAARLAAQSCKLMLWQQARATGKNELARRMAGTNIRDLQLINRDFNRLWPARNKATPAKCSTFIQWRISDYRQACI
jgi:hypothetical protein